MKMDGSLYYQRIKSVYGSLRASEKKVADFAMSYPEKIIKSSMQEVAAEVGVSDPTIIRFVRAANYKGFQDFKLSVAQDLGQMQGQEMEPLSDIELRPDEDISDIPQKIIGSVQQTLQETLDVLDLDQLKAAIACIRKARRVDVYGVGNSAIVARDIVIKLMRLDITARSYDDEHMQMLSACNLSSEDVVIGVTHSGRTRSILRGLEMARARGAKTIIISNYRASGISEYADIKLLTGSKEVSYFSDSMTSRISQLALVDMLYCGIMLCDYDTYISAIDRYHDSTSQLQI